MKKIIEKYLDKFNREKPENKKNFYEARKKFTYLYL